MKKKKVIEYTERWTVGGIESYIVNLIKYLDRSKFSIEVVVAQKETDIYDKELSKYECRIKTLLPEIISDPIKRIIKNKEKLRNHLEKSQCDVLHLHICQGVAMGYAKMAKSVGIKKVITHCHNTEIGDGKRLIKLLGHHLGKRIYRRYVDDMLACSDIAAKWLYLKRDLIKNNVYIIKGIVDVDRFKYSKDVRKHMRNKYGIADETVYLNIGRMHYQKNQKFLLEIYGELIRLREKCMLIIIGNGELKQEIQDYAKQLDLSKSVVFIDQTKEVEKYMNMADIFILPSLFEGNPIVGIEAQASGLPCIFSDTITRQAKVLKSAHFIDLKNAPEIWAKDILHILEENSDYDRSVSADIMKINGYNIPKQISSIERLYED